ncbi:hypothetical protein [Paenibacillus sp. FSL R5-808]|jgi:hypothetical protein|uniref:hypothetical protein n=1 Tax=unclassified Paenibacillus TaxID=185978 RepID=UPI0003E1ED9B|nr:hypothetical protein [Paenibacillus sp. FSL R5-808]ETT32149.1 hypothetical protein C169_24105 [Paenibacillus sp. FSL R5-808]
MSDIILTKDGLEKFKAELHDILTVKLPEAMKEFEEVCVVFSSGDFPYEDVKRKLDFYCHRWGYLQRAIDRAKWDVKKSCYKTMAQAKAEEGKQ